jgi:hypothetical protein
MRHEEAPAKAVAGIDAAPENKQFFIISSKNGKYIPSL